MNREPLKPGESRVIRVIPCPPDWHSRTNEYYKLRRAASRLYEKSFDLLWHQKTEGSDRLEAIEILRNLAMQQPTTPIKRWYDYHGEIREICCPACEHVFEHEGNFYAPYCPNCKRWLENRRLLGDKGKAE